MMGMASSSSIGVKTSGVVGKDSKPPSDNVERRSNALAVLKLICESQVFAPHLEALLAMQDAQVMDHFFRLFHFVAFLVTQTIILRSSGSLAVFQASFYISNYE